MTTLITNELLTACIDNEWKLNSPYKEPPLSPQNMVADLLAQEFKRYYRCENVSVEEQNIDRQEHVFSTIDMKIEYLKQGRWDIFSRMIIALKDSLNYKLDEQKIDRSQIVNVLVSDNYGLMPKELLGFEAIVYYLPKQL